jgi:hypothetical protein
MVAKQIACHPGRHGCIHTRLPQVLRHKSEHLTLKLAIWRQDFEVKKTEEREVSFIADCARLIFQELLDVSQGIWKAGNQKFDGIDPKRLTPAVSRGAEEVQRGLYVPSSNCARLCLQQLTQAGYRQLSKLAEMRRAFDCHYFLRAVVRG